MEKTVLSKEEITKLSSLQQQQDTFIIQLGQIEYQKNMLDQQKHKINQQIESFDTTTVRASVPMYLLSKYIKEKT